MLTFVFHVFSTRDNSRFASCGNDRAVLCWDVSAGSVIRRYAGHYESVNCVGFNDDGTVLASGSFDTTIRLWDCRSQSHSPIQILEDCKDSVMSLQIVGVELIVGYVFGCVYYSSYFNDCLCLLYALVRQMDVYEIMIFEWASCMKITLEVG